MVEIRSKKTGKILLIGKIIKNGKSTIKLNTSNRISKKENIFIQYVIALFIVGVFSVSCVSKKYTAKQLKKLKVTDSIRKAEINSRILDLQEEMHEHLNDRNY